MPYIALDLLMTELPHMEVDARGAAFEQLWQRHVPFVTVEREQREACARASEMLSLFPYSYHNGSYSICHPGCGHER